MPHPFWLLLATFGLLAGTSPARGAGPSETLGPWRNGFASPPAEARPWVYWFWMDGNISREGITADLEAMRRVGIGGLILMEVDVGVPRGPVKFMSDTWRALFKHAVLEAERLGLEITLNAGPGWTGSGGPWVKPEQSMQHLVASVVEVSGPTNLDLELPEPAPREPHFVHAPIPASLREVRDAFYRDVAVVAFPTPDGQARITESDEKALYYRNPYSSSPGVKPYLPAPAVFAAVPTNAVIAVSRVLDLSNHLRPDGRLDWSVPAGRWTVMRFGRASTGANTRPAPEPGIGLESDKFDRGALEAHFDAFVGALLREIGPRPDDRRSGWTMLHIDSWEMGAQNWSPRFRDEFRHRRGYDPLPYLPAFTGRVVGSLEISERFLWDVRQTAQELVIENHARHLKALGRRHGFGLSIEPYDMNPCSDLSLGGEADVPMCEFWAAGYGFNTVFSCLEAVSIAHTLGRPIVAAEAFTADAPEAWKLHPGAMKAQADWAFCFGINRLVVHRYAHQPWLDRWPGMTMGPYGVHYERTQTWWDLSPAWHAYLARCQFMLRRGLPVADICYVAAEGAPHVFRPPASALVGTPPVPDRRGYNFDACAPETVVNLMSVKDGRITLPGGMSYRVLVLPESQTMTPALLRKVGELLRAGATVLGPPPLKSPSLSGYPACDAEITRLASELWGPSVEAGVAVERKVGQGRLIALGKESDPAGAGARGGVGQGAATSLPTLYPSYEQVAEILSTAGVLPDFEAVEALRYTHRRDADSDMYLVANREAAPVRATCAFRVVGKQPELWDPMTGEARALPGYYFEGGRTMVPLEFEPHGSWFVVFREAVTRPPSPNADNLPKWQTALEVPGPWQVEFQPGRGAPDRVAFNEPSDWAAHPNTGVRYFSGTATYRAKFELSADQLAPLKAGQARIDLGQVHVMAQVRLNGRDLGVAWKSPFQLTAGDALRVGDNTLEIVVANLWPNRLIGDRALPAADSVTWTTWNPYKPDSALLPSGLIGPVTLRHEEPLLGNSRP